MTDETGYGVLTDVQWADLAPLIAQSRPPHKMEHKNLRRTIEAGQFNALYCQLDGAVGFMKGHLHEGPL